MSENALFVALNALPQADRKEAAAAALAALNHAARRRRDEAIVNARALWPSLKPSAAARALEREISIAGRNGFRPVTEHQKATANIRRLNAGKKLGHRSIINIWISMI